MLEVKGYIIVNNICMIEEDRLIKIGPFEPINLNL